MLKIAGILASFLCFFTLPSISQADDTYSSKFINQSDKGSQQYTLVKTRFWPDSGCIMQSGPEVLQPGDSTELVIAKKQGCDQAGIGYSLYKVSDTKKEQLLGYVSHRFRDGTFSLQISVFCKNEHCVFKDLNPQQSE